HGTLQSLRFRAQRFFSNL
ncbi:autotransporter beta-domain protein, partial [Chlamydia psittaci 84-8471/1]